MGDWINFKELRARLDFRDVLAHYDVELQVKGDQAQGFCPLPTHNGKKRSPSFSINLARGIWQCFGCGMSGNVLDFAVRMEGKSPNNAAEFRAVAIGLQEWINLKSTPSGPLPAVSTRSTSTPQSDSSPRRQHGHSEPPKVMPAAAPIANRNVKVNAPLDFRLQGLQPEHPYLLSRGFNAQTIWKFGLGYCSRGLMAGRIAIPLYDLEDRLVGYAGRLVDDSLISADNPKYKLPARRERGDEVLEFHKSRLVYNANRLKGPLEHLVIVEGFPSVWWMDQAGFENIVALMGSSCSAEQAEIILGMTSADARVQVLPDGDEAGQRFAHSVFEALGPCRWVRWHRLSGGRQPTDCEADELAQFNRV